MSNLLFNKVLVAVDDSEQSVRAVEMAIKLAKTSVLSSIVLFNVYDSGSIDVTKLHNTQKLDELRAASLALLQNYEKMLAAEGINGQLKKAGGEPASLIIDIVENDSEYDLIIIGSRKLNKFKEIAFGSVSDKITRLVNIPVMVIK